MNRKDKILSFIKKDGAGLEIGPSYNPIASKREGFNVETIDHASAEELRTKYISENVDVSRIEKVDYIWSGENLSELVGKTKCYDWIIASHVIEHTPDFIGFLNECEVLLKDDGVLSLAIPDVRYCFDYFRPITGLSRIIDAHVCKHKTHSAGSVAEFLLNYVTINDNVAWNKKTKLNDFQFKFSIEDVKKRLDYSLSDEKYYDVHSWCFVPSSFRLLIHDLNCLNLISLKELMYYDTAGCEFHVSLSKRTDKLEINRLDLLQNIKTEMCRKKNFLKFI